MPTYEYACSRCGCRFDVRQSFNEPPKASCPKCKSPARRVFQPVPIVFKGSGFYCTDNGKSGTINSPKAKSEKSEKTDALPKPKTETASTTTDSK